MTLYTITVSIIPGRKSGEKILQEFLRKRWRVVYGKAKTLLLTKASV